MDSAGILILLGILMCLGLLGLVSGVLTSLDHLDPEGIKRLRRRVPLRRDAARVLRYAGQRPQAWATIVTVRTVALVGLAALAVSLALRWAPGVPWAPIPALLLAVALALLAKAWARALALRNPQRGALALMLPFAALSWACRPLASLLVEMPVARLSRPEATERQDGQGAPASTEKEAYEQRMIRAILRLEETSVREIMVPRIDMVAISSRASVREAMDLIIAEGYSRVPVYEETLDNVVGVLHTKDLLPFVGGQPPQGRGTARADAGELRPLARKPYFVPETKKVDELLREMQDRRVQLAIAVDEYGGTAGLVTIEDVVEEIVGDIEDEFDVAEQQVARVSDAEAIMDGRVSVDEMARMFGVEVQGEGFDTVGGYVLHLLGKVPTVGDQVATDQLRIDVLSTLGRRVKRVRVTRVAPEAEPEQAHVPPP